MVALSAWCLLVCGPLLVAARAAGVDGWSTAAPMLIARSGGVAAELTDGRVLVSGGRDRDGTLLTDAEIYDPATNSWSATAPAPVAFASGGAAPLPGDRVLVVGGFTHGFAPVPPEIFDARTGRWTATAPPPIDLEGAVAAPLSDGRALVYAGQSAFAYDPSTDSWSWLAAPGGFDGEATGAAALPDGGVIVTGDNASSFTENYDPASQTWSYGQTPEIFSPALWSAPVGPPVALPDGHVVIAGGYSSPQGVVAYDPTLHGWAGLADMPVARQNDQAAALPGGRMLVAGGTTPSGTALASVSIFTPPSSYPAPVDVTEPMLDGRAVVGDTLTATGGAGKAFLYQWQRCPATGACTDIGPPEGPLAGAGRYTITPSDVGSRIVAEITVDGATISNSTYPSAVVAWPSLSFDAAQTWQVSSDDPTFVLRRNGTGGAASVAYQIAAAPGAIATFAPINGLLHFAAGQASATLPLPSTDDHGAPILTRAITVQLSSPEGIGLIPPSQTTLHVCNGRYGGCGVGPPRDPANPLMLAAQPPASDPLTGARFSADYLQSAAARAAAAVKRRNPAEAQLLEGIALQPNVARFGAWNGSFPGGAVAAYLARIHQQEPGAVPMLSTYRVVDGHCGSWADPPADQAAYHAWITSFAEGIGYSPAVVFLEMDSLITTGCLTHHGLAVRLAELRDAVDTLTKLPHVVVYLDAGAADALPARETASLLRRAGVAAIQGFFLNSTHFDWTRKEIAYGERVSRMLGGKHFVVNTAENGQGPLIPRDRAHRGNEVLCNPPNRGLGPLPTADTGFKNVDAFAWIANPGVSGGQCRPGAPRTGRFWPALAIELARHADFKVR